MAHASIRYRDLKKVAEAAREVLSAHDEGLTSQNRSVADSHELYLTFEHLRDVLEKIPE